MPFRTSEPIALTDHSTTPKSELGSIRVEQDLTYGTRIFRYVHNDSGAAIAEGDSCMYDGELEADVTANGGGTTYATRATGSFVTDGVSPGDILIVVDDAGAAGAAPELEYSVITTVAALRVDFSPALTTAIANGDLINFFKQHNVKVTADPTYQQNYAGVAMSAIADAEYGYVQESGVHPAALVVASGTAILEGANLMASASSSHGRLIAATDVTGGGKVVATCLIPIQSDTVRRRTMVRLGPMK